MSKPGYTQTTAFGLGDDESRRAGEVVGQVLAGEMVSPDVLSRASEALANALWRGESSLLATAQDGLSVLVGAIGGTEAQAQVLGDVIAAGANGVPVFDKLTARGGAVDAVAGIDPAEMRALRDSLTRSPHERLALIASMLQAELPVDQNAPERSTPSRKEGLMEAVLPRSRPSLEDVTEGDDSPSGSGPDGNLLISTADGSHTPAHRDSRTVLFDKSLDPSLRFDAAMAMAGTALPDLATMLRGEKTEMEVAAVALAKLGADPKLARQVWDQMKILECEPDTRRTAEHIRRGIEDGTGDWSGNQPYPSDQANMGDGWLGRAIASCDRPVILQAAFGREKYAIPMALRQLASMRSKRLAAHD